MSGPLTLGPGDRIRLRPGDRPRVYAFGQGRDEHGEATFTRGAETVTLAGQAFTVREDGDRIVLRDTEGDELLSADPRRRGRIRIGGHDLELPGKKPGKLGDAGEVRLQDGIVVLEVKATVPPLVALFALTVVVLRLKLAEPKDQRPDWNPQASQAPGTMFGG